MMIRATTNRSPTHMCHRETRARFDKVRRLTNNRNIDIRESLYERRGSAHRTLIAEKLRLRRCESLEYLNAEDERIRGRSN